MIKFGITSRGPRLDRALQLEAEHKGWWPFAFTLLEDIEQSYTSADEPLIERLYRAMSAGDGVWKITKTNRFCDLDKKLSAEFERRFSPGTRLRIHDMAVSNGVTSLEWYERLSEHWKLQFTASDYYEYLSLVGDSQTGWTCVFDAADRPLQCVGQHFVIPLTRRELWRYPVNLAVQQWIRKTVVPRAQASLEAAASSQSMPDTGSSVRRISLFHPRCQQLAHADSTFQLRQHSFFDRPPETSHVVRVMNALTPHHFGEEQLMSALRTCAAAVRVGGVFIIGRSIDEEDGRCAATAYERTVERLVPLWDFQEGSDVKPIIAEMPSLAEAEYAT